MSQYPSPYSPPPQYPYPGYYRPADLLAPARRASWLMFALAAVMCVLTLFLREVKLRTSSGLERPSEDVAMTGDLVGSADAELGSGVAIG